MPYIPFREVVAVNNIDGDEPVETEFQSIINAYRERGFDLESWKMSRLIDSEGSDSREIIAVFVFYAKEEAEVVRTGPRRDIYGNID